MQIASRSPRSRLPRPRMIGAIAALAAASLLAGCFGVFPLTKTTYRFNKESSPNEFVQSVMFWVFMIVPVYEVSVTVDMIVLNVIEFWSEAPIKLADSPPDAAPGRPAPASSDSPSARLDPSVTIEGRDLMISFARADGSRGQIALRRTGPEAFDVIDDRTGARAGRIARAESGEILLFDRDGALARRLPPAAIPAS